MEENSLQLLELHATITGEYNPPTHIDFKNIVSNVLSTKGGVFVEELKTEEEHVSASSVFNICVCCASYISLLYMS